MKYVESKWNWGSKCAAIGIGSIILLADTDHSHTKPQSYDYLPINEAEQMEQRSGPIQVGSETDWSDSKLNNIKRSIYTSNGLHWMW